METVELLQRLAAGEDTQNQFKEDFTSPEKLASEMVAFSNGAGGNIFIGIGDNGSITGLAGDSVRRLNQMISNVASQHIQPPINPTTQNILTDKGIVIVVTVAEGVNRPYQDKDGVFWVKNGSDKRKATSREELQRLFQVSSLIHADETAVNDTFPNDIDLLYFSSFYRTQYGTAPDESGIPFPQLLRNLNLTVRDGRLNIAGMLLFGKSPQTRLPAFVIKAVAFRGTDITTGTYLDSRDLEGKIVEQFNAAIAFLVNNTGTRQNGRSVNSIGEPEIPRIVWEELTANALIHRDYFTSAAVRIFVFSDRVEIISPGHLPNKLTIENIKAGNSNIRNPIIASFAAKMIPYRGLGSGILRALAAYPDIDFIDDRSGNLFKAIIHRKAN